MRPPDESEDTNELLGRASADMLAPISAIVGMIDGVLETALTVDQRRRLEMIRASAGDVFLMASDLLDWSKLETGELVLDEANFFLHGTVADAVRPLVVRAQKQGLALTHAIQPDVPDALVGDAGRLRQILRILIESAIEQTEAGTIALDVGMDGLDEDDAVRLRFSIRSGGLGDHLGTRVATRLSALMGGEVVLGPECTFTARFAQQPQAPRRVLLVGANDDHRRRVRAWLCEAGVDSITVSDGFEAIDSLWDSITSGRPFAAVLVELQPQRTDAESLIDRIRSRPELAATRIVLVVPGECADSLPRDLDLTIDAYLPKPVVRDELLELLRGLW